MVPELKDGAAEDVGSETLLSVFLLAGLAPMDGRQLEDAAVRPAWEQAEQVAQVGQGLDRVEPAAREERHKGGIDLAGLVVAEKEPIAATDHLPAQGELGVVVVHRQPAVVQEPLQRGLLVATVAERMGD